MKIRFVLAVMAGAAILGGCQSGSATRLAPPVAAIGAAKSWMGPPSEVANASLIYLTDFNGNVVYVYDYGNGKQVGELTGFTNPDGECVDAKGDVYITNYYGSKVDEFAHGGSKPIRTLNTTGLPIGCSVDRYGDLAVTNFEGASNDATNLCVWKRGASGASCYTETDLCYFMWAPGYDDKGDVIVEGQGKFNERTTVCALMRGASSMTTLDYNGKIYFPGGVMWDGKYVALTDQFTPAAGSSAQTGIYQAKLEGTSLKWVGTTILGGGCDEGNTDVVMPFVVGAKNTPVNEMQGKVVIGGNLDCTGNRGTLSFWRYPKGSDYKTYFIAAFEPNGQVVSIAK